MVQAVVHQQESHLRTGRFEPRGRVYTLEYPEYLIVGHVDTGGHIHPHTQRVGDIQPLGIGGGVVRNIEHEAAEAEVGQTYAGNALLRRDGIGDAYARGRSGGKVGVVLEEDGVVHTVGDAHIVVVAIAQGTV